MLTIDNKIEPPFTFTKHQKHTGKFCKDCCIIDGENNDGEYVNGNISQFRYIEFCHTNARTYSMARHKLESDIDGISFLDLLEDYKLANIHGFCDIEELNQLKLIVEYYKQRDGK